MTDSRRGRALIVLWLLTATASLAGCTAFFPTDPDGRERSFCVTQNGGESLLCCPSPGLGCQAVEATQ